MNVATETTAPIMEKYNKKPMATVTVSGTLQLT
jgi:hypothetical protein